MLLLYVRLKKSTLHTGLERTGYQPFFRAEGKENGFYLQAD